MAIRKMVQRKPLQKRSNPPKRRFGKEGRTPSASITYPENRPGWHKPVKLNPKPVGTVTYPENRPGWHKPVRLKTKKRR